MVFSCLCCCHSSWLIFFLYQQNKVKFRQASNCCRRVLEAAKISYANNKRVHHFPETWLSRTFSELLIVFSIKVNYLLYLPYSTAQRSCLLYLIKKNCLIKTFLRTVILMTWVSLDLFSLLELLKLHKFM